MVDGQLTDYRIEVTKNFRCWIDGQWQQRIMNDEKKWERADNNTGICIEVKHLMELVLSLQRHGIEKICLDFESEYDENDNQYALLFCHQNVKREYNE